MSKKSLISIFVLLLLFSGGVFLYKNGRGFFKAQVAIEEPFLKETETISDNLENENAQELNKEQEVSFKESRLVEKETDSTLDNFQENLDDISEKIDILNQEIIKLTRLEEENISEKTSEIEQEQELEEPEEDSESEKNVERPEEQLEDVGQEEEQIICDKMTADLPQRNKIVFDEIAWMGGISSANDEWIELKNISEEVIDLTGWQILDKDDQIKIFLKEKFIPAGGLFLLERTNDDSVPNIPADLVYTGSLNDADEELYLFNTSCGLEDEVLADPDWPAGEKTDKKTMERGTDLSWHNYYGMAENSIYGTPREENSVISVQTAGGGGSVTQSVVSESVPKILISEIQTASADSVKDEWVELFNPNLGEADISLWSIQKASESGTLYKKNFVSGNIIPSQGYFLIANSQASDSILELADLTHASFDLTDNNTIFLVKNQDKIEGGEDIDIIDKVGFGNAFSPEKNPAPNSGKDESIERKDNQDTDDNFQDFILQANPSPKGETVLKPDITPPIVIFSPISATQNNPLFSLSWTAEDPIIGNASPSGLDGIYLQYTVTPSDIDGIQYQDQENNWQKWGEEILEISDGQNNLQILGKEGSICNFKIKAKDKAGNESQWSETSMQIVSSEAVISVVINEIAWMGTTESSFKEWVELYNNADSEINLTGWVLKSLDGTPNINLIGIIPAKGFYLLERTGDDTLPEVSADQVYTGALGNQGEELELYNSNSEMIDKVSCNKDNNVVCQEWFAGDNISKSTMERKNTVLSGDNIDNWATSQNPGGTPKLQNSRYIP